MKTEMSLLKISLPLYLTRGVKKPKKVPLNLNIYRNLHYRTNNAMKQEWKNIVQSALVDSDCLSIKLDGQFTFIYTIYPPNKRKFDLGNVCSIIQKYTDDALISLGVIEDDNYLTVSEVIYRIADVDKDNPRAELIVQGAPERLL